MKKRDKHSKADAFSLKRNKYTFYWYCKECNS